MTGHSNRSPSALAAVLWPDASLDRVTVDYDAVVLQIRESTGTRRSVRCEGHIGLEFGGFWDELVIQSAGVFAQHPAIDRAVASITARLGSTWIDSGNAHRNSRTWKALIIRLSDGCRLEIVAASFTVE